MKLQKSCLSALLLSLLLCLLLSACSTTKDESAGDDTNFDARADDSLIIEMTGRDSLTVFDILVAAHDVAYLATASGVFVRAIDSIENNNRYFWLFSVNDTVVMEAADKYITSRGDRIRWHYRKITP
ncbi:MAG: DUF4430 domain-containing protein [Candidatus Zixiibacteriota bacterium]|nr:MAG: DUF4430 domain-containing protein [candidate division Zixibacteria bacterium]